MPQIAHCRGAGQDFTLQPCHPAPSLPRHCAPGRGGVRASFLPWFIPSPHCILSPREGLCLARATSCQPPSCLMVPLGTRTGWSGGNQGRCCAPRACFRLLPWHFLPRFSSSGVWDGSVRRERRGRQHINRVMARHPDGSHEVRAAGAWDVGSALPCRGSSAALFSGINPHHHPPL